MRQDRRMQCSRHLLQRSHCGRQVSETPRGQRYESAEAGVHVARRLSALGDGPHHQRLSAPRVARCKDARHSGPVLLCGSSGAARIQPQRHVSGETIRLGPNVSDRQEHQGGRPPLFCSSLRAEPPSCAAHPHRTQCHHTPRMPLKSSGYDAPTACSIFLIRSAGAKDHGIDRPWLMRGRLGRGHRQQLKLRHRPRPLPICRPHAVATGVSTTDNVSVP